MSEALKLDAYASFRLRDYRFLLAGAFLSNFGLQMLSVAVSWDLYLQTRSALVLGNVGFVQVAPYLLFSLISEHVADRYDRRQVMLLTQYLYIAASVALALNFSSVAVIYGCLLMTATARSFQAPARGAILPQIVPCEGLANAITWNSSAQEIANVSGPAIAGLLLATAGSRTVYIAQVVCATLTLFCFASIRHRRAKPSRLTARCEVVSRRAALSVREQTHPRRRVSRHVRSSVWRSHCPAAHLRMDILHAGARGLGLLRAAPSIGAVLMALTLAHSHRIVRAGNALLLTVAGFGVATIAFGLSRNLWFSLAMLVPGGRMRQRERRIASVSDSDEDSRSRSGPGACRELYLYQLFESVGRRGIRLDSGVAGSGYERVGGGTATLVVVAICAACRRS